MVLRAHVGADPVEVAGGHVELVAVGVFQDQVFLFFPVVAQVGGAGEPGNPVVDVDDESAGHQVGQRHLRPALRPPRALAAAFLHRAEQLGVGEQFQPGHRAVSRRSLGRRHIQHPAVPQRAGQNGDLARPWRGLQALHHGGVDTLLAQDFRQPPGVLRDGHRGVTLVLPPPQVGGQLLQPSVVRGGGLEHLVLFLAHPGLQLKARRLLQLAGELFPAHVGRGEIGRQLAPLLPRRPHPAKPLLQFGRFRLHSSRAVQHQRAVGAQVVEQVGPVHQAVIEGKDFGVGVGGQSEQFLLHPVADLGVATAEVQGRGAVGQGFRADEAGQLLPGRDGPHLGRRPHRALGVGIEVTDGVDLVVEQLYSQRQLGVGREDVQDAAPVAEAAGRLDHRLVAVAQGSTSGPAPSRCGCGRPLAKGRALPSMDAGRPSGRRAACKAAPTRWR